MGKFCSGTLLITAIDILHEGVFREEASQCRTRVFHLPFHYTLFQLSTAFMIILYFSNNECQFYLEERRRNLEKPG